MANKKITELDAATSLASTDVVPVVDVSEDVTKKITATNLFRTLPDGTAAAPALAFSSDQANGVYLAGTDTVGISTGGTQRVTVDGSGNVTISGGLTVEGQTTTVESTIVTIDDKNIELGSVASPSNTTADGGGITLKGATDKTIKWINSTGFWTFNTGVEIDGNLQMDDGKKIRLGGGQDLQIFHDGNDSYLHDAGNGSLIVRASRFRVNNAANTENIIRGDENGAVYLYYDNSQKLITKSDGIDVTGEVQCDSLDVDGALDIDGGQIYYDAANNNLHFIDNVKARFGTGSDLRIYHDGSNSFIDEAGTGQLFIRAHDRTNIQKYTGETCAQFIADGAVNLYHDGTIKFSTKSDGIDVAGEVQCDSLDVDGSGDIAGTLTTNRLIVDDDGSASPLLSVRADDSSPWGVTVSNFTYSTNDDHGLAFGVDNDGDGTIRLIGDGVYEDFRLQQNNGTTTQTAIHVDTNRAVNLQYQGSTKFSTKSDGINVVGEVECDSLDVDGNADVTGHIKLGPNGRIGVAGSTATPETAIKFVDSDNINIIVGNSEKARIDNSGRLLLGTTSPLDTGAEAVVHVVDTLGARLVLGRNDTSVADGNGLGGIRFAGNDTTSNTYTTLGEIVCQADGTHAAGDNPTRLKFKTTPDGSSSPIERMRIDSSGRVGIGATPGNQEQLLVHGGDNSIYVPFARSDSKWITIHSGGTDPAIFCDYGGSIRFGHGASRNAFATERMRLDTSGRLLLGTTTAGQGNADNLTIYDSSDAGITIRTGASNNGNIFFSDATSGTDEYDGFIQYRHFDRALRFATGATERFRITVTGAWAIEGASNYGTSGQVLTSNGNDAPSWQDAAGGGAGGASAISMNDNVKINFGNSNDLQIYHDGSNSYIDDAGTGNLKLNGNEVHILSNDNSEYCARFISNGAVRLFHDNSKKFETKSDGVDIIGELQCDSLDVDGDSSLSGDVDFIGDDYNVVWDKSEDRLKFNDNAKAAFGTSADFILIHNGSNTHLENYTGGLYIDQNLNDGLIALRSDNGSGGLSDYIKCQGSSGEVFLYHYGSQKFKTKSDGVDITGEVQCDSLDIDGNADISGTLSLLGNLDMNDSDRIRLGDGDDLEIYHDGSNSYIKDVGTGNLLIQGGLVAIQSTGGETIAKFTADGASVLNHNGSQKLATKSDGVDVTGEVQCDSLDVDGASNFSGVPVFQSNVGIGNTTVGNNFANGKALALGDNDTGIRQNGDGVLELWSNNQQCFRVRNSGNLSYKTLSPNSNNSLDLGSSSLRWRNIYTNDLNLSNEGGGNDVDGTWGNYTIQEGEDDLFLINRRNGKKYKFNLTEVS